MICRYCGQELKSMGQRLRSSYSEKCKASPTAKHVALATGTECVYCGEPVKVSGQVLRSKYSDRCPSSPNGKHALQ